MPSVYCALCGELIQKYLMDVGDTCFVTVKEENKYICEDCSKEIALQRISR